MASHPGWDDSAAWQQQAESDARGFLRGLSDEWLAPAHVLEVGCGVGRLAGPLRARGRSYTGVDIAPAMVAEARRRHEGADDMRFLVGDGLHVATEAGDRQYKLALAIAVFIHCPPEVIRSLVQSAYALLEPGGELRYQLRADINDSEGIGAPPDDEGQVEHERQLRAIEATATPADLALITDSYSMGHAFRFAEAGPFLREATGGEVEVLRFDSSHLYGWVRKV